MRVGTTTERRTCDQALVLGQERRLPARLQARSALPCLVSPFHTSSGSDTHLLLSEHMGVFLWEGLALSWPSGFLFSRLVCGQVSGRGMQAGQDRVGCGGVGGWRWGSRQVAHACQPRRPVGVTWEA